VVENNEKKEHKDVVELKERHSQGSPLKEFLVRGGRSAFATSKRVERQTTWTRGGGIFGGKQPKTFRGGSEKYQQTGPVILGRKR